MCVREREQERESKRERESQYKFTCVPTNQGTLKCFYTFLVNKIKFIIAEVPFGTFFEE
jgi:hypothetical protein